MRVDRAIRRCAVVLAVLLGATAPAAAAVPRADPVAPADPPPASDLSAGDEVDPRGEDEPVSEAERAVALAEPAIAVIEVRWEGYLHDRDTGELLEPTPVAASSRCTGVGVGSEGYLLTTRSCLTQAAVAMEVVRQVVERRVADGRTSADAADDLVSELLAVAMIGTEHSDDPPERSIFVRRAVTDDVLIPASVVLAADPLAGDAVLLKIARSNQPVLTLAADEDLVPSTELVTVECPVETDVVTEPAGGEDTEVEPGPGRKKGSPKNRATDDGGSGPCQQYRTGTVRETEPHVLVEPTEPAETEAVLPGGVVLTHDAEIAGLVDASLSTGDLLVDLTAIRELLAGADVQTGLGQVDRDYRAGLDAFYAGRYGDAIARFDSVLAIIPSHEQAHRYRDEAQSLREAEGEPQPPPAEEVVDRVESWLNGRSWSLVGVVVLAAIVVFLVHRRRPPLAEVTTQPSAEGTTDGSTERPGQ